MSSGNFRLCCEPSRQETSSGWPGEECEVACGCLCKAMQNPTRHETSQASFVPGSSEWPLSGGRCALAQPTAEAS